MQSTKIFRLFVSSTFSDFQLERAVLQDTVFPRVRQYCERRGATFQPVDLRWGISDDLARDRQTMQICLSEIARSRALSPRPNFLVLVGDRYGWRPLPDTLPESVFERVCELVDPAARDDLRHAYARDDNAVPPCFTLKPRNPSAGADDDALEHRLGEHFRQAAPHCDPSVRLLLDGGATHQEIVRGIFEQPDAHEHAVGWFRRLDGIAPHIDPARPPATLLADYDTNGMRDVDSRHRLDDLEDRIRASLDAPLLGSGTLTVAQFENDCPERERYLRAFARHVLATLLRIVRDAFRAHARTSALDDENAAHARFADERARDLTGRDALIEHLGRYLAPSKRARVPLVVSGPGGSGKSSVLAAVSRAASASAKHACVARFVGVTGTSSTLASLVTDVCAQLDRLYRPDAPSPTFIAPDALKAALAQRLALASAARPIALFLDGLDQLPPAERACTLLWLPMPLPKHVRVVMSCRDTLPVADRADRITLEPLSAPDASRLLDTWLAERERTLTAEQRRTVLDGFAACALPLWLKLAFEIASGWSSTTEPQSLPGTLDGIIGHTFDVLARRHPHALLKHALGYLAASRHGLSEVELGRLLASTPQVLDEFRRGSYFAWDVAARGLPPVLWSRLRLDLAAYLTEKHVDGNLLCTFFHLEFSAAALARLDAADQRACRQRIAAAFSTPDGTELIRATERREPDALRRLTEQAWQLNTCGETQAVRALLVDFSYLMAKCAARRVADLLDDYRNAEACDGTLHAWRRFFEANASLLLQDRPDWPAHRILLQLAAEEADDSPIATAADRWLASGACTWLWLRRRDRPRHATVPALRARFICPEPPADVSAFEKVLPLPDGRLATLDPAHDHREEDSVFGKLGYLDTFVRVWNRDSGLIELELRGHRNSVSGFTDLPGGRLATASLDGTVRLWSLDDGKCLQIENIGDVKIDALAKLPSSRLLLACDDGRVECRRHDDLSLLATMRHGGGWCELEPVDDLHAIVVARDGETVVERWLWRTDGDTATQICRDGHVVVPDADRPGRSSRVFSWEAAREDAPDAGVRCARVAWNDASLDAAALFARAPARASTGKPSDVSVRSATSLGDGTVAVTLDDGQLCVVDAADRTIVFCDMRGATSLDEPDEGYRDAGTLRFANGDLCDWHSAGDQYCIRRWSRDGTPLANWTGERALIALSQCADGLLLLRFMFVDEGNPTMHPIERWDPESGRCVTRMIGHYNYVNDARELPDGNFVSWSLDDGTVRTWDRATGHARAVFNLRGFVNAVWLLDDGTVLASIYDTLFRYDCAHVDSPGPACGGIHVDGGLALTWQDSRHAVLWRRATRQALLRIANPGGWTGARMLTPDHLLAWDTHADQWTLWKRRGDAAIDAEQIATIALPVTYRAQSYASIDQIGDVVMFTLTADEYDRVHVVVHRLDNGECIVNRLLPIDKASIESTDVRPVGTDVLVLLYRGSATLVRIAGSDATTDDMPPIELAQTDDGVLDVRVLENGSFATIAKRCVKVWSAAGQCTLTLRLKGDGIRDAVVAHGRMLIASATHYRIVDLRTQAASDDATDPIEAPRGFAITRVTAAPDGRLFVEMRKGKRQQLDVVDPRAGVARIRLAQLPEIDQDSRAPTALDTVDACTGDRPNGDRGAYGIFAVFGSQTWCVCEPDGRVRRTFDGSFDRAARFALEPDRRTLLAIEYNCCTAYDLDDETPPRRMTGAVPLACFEPSAISVTDREDVFMLRGTQAYAEPVYWAIDESGGITGLSDLVDGTLMAKGYNGIYGHQDSGFWLDAWHGGRRLREAPPVAAAVPHAHDESSMDDEDNTCTAR